MRINFFRGIRHKNEEAYAPFIPLGTIAGPSRSPSGVR